MSQPRLKHLLVAVALGPLLLFLLTVPLALYLSLTTGGLQQLVSLAQRHVPGDLRIRQVEGTLLDAVTLRGIEFRDSNSELKLAQLQLAWTPRALLSGSLHIRKLSLEQLQLSLPPASPPHNPLQLPQLNIPVAIQLDQFQLRQLTLIQNGATATSEPKTLIQQATLRAHSQEQTLVLDQFTLTAPQGQFSASGSITPNGDFPLQLSTDWQLDLPDHAPLNGHGQVSGPLAKLQLEQQLSGLFEAQLSAQLQPLFEPPRLHASVDILKLDLGLAAPRLKGQPLSGRLLLDGDQTALDLQGEFKAKLPDVGSSALTFKVQLTEQQLQINQLLFSQLPSNKNTPTTALPISRAQLYLEGTVREWQSTPQLVLKGHWLNLGYPLLGQPDYTSPKGQFELTGTLAQYRLNLKAVLQGTQIPSGEWRLDAQGNQTGLSPFNLTGSTLEGQLQAQGSIDWQPDLRWQAVIKGQQLNTAVLLPDWPAKLDFSVHSGGTLAANQPLQLQAVLDDLSGTLRGKSLQGNALINLKGDDLVIQQLDLSMAGMTLAASGALGQQLDLDWSLQAPSLTNLLPDAQGELSGHGRLRGPKDKPHLSATLQGKQLQLDRFKAASLDADLDINLSGAQASLLRLEASGLNLQGYHWQQISLNGTGTPQQHRLSLTLEQGPADLQLAIAGRWQDSLWQGELSRFDIQTPLSGPLQLQRSAKIQASTTGASLDPLCWQRQPEGKLCLQGSWTQNHGSQGQLSAQQLPLRLLDPWLPPGTSVEGQLQTQAQFAILPGQAPTFDAHLRLSGTRLRLAEEDLNIEAGEVNFDIQGLQQQLNATLQLPLLEPPGHITAQMRLNDLYQHRDLDGQLSLELSDLRFISLLVPQLQAISGHLNASVTLDGQLEQPRFKGSLNMRQASAELPALGIRLDEIDLSLQDQTVSDALTIQGTLRSGEGRLQLSGEIDPLTQSGQLNLTGERLQAIATPEIRAWISPALDLTLSPALIELRGEIKIPEAKIKPPQLSSSTPASADVVIIDPHTQQGTRPTAAAKRRLDARVRLTLGDKIDLDALGFKGRLQGSVLIEDDARRATRATGSMRVAAGQYRIYGQDLNIERGSLVFSGGPIDNPGLDLRVSRQVEEATVGAKVSGSLTDPRLTLFSEPAMPESNLLSYLLLGRPLGYQASSSEQEMLLNAASALAMMGGNSVAENIQQRLNIDELGFDGGSTLNETSFYIGKYLSPRLYVKYGIGLLEPTSTFFIRYQLSKRWNLESQTGTRSSGGDIIFTLEH